MFGSDMYYIRMDLVAILLRQMLAWEDGQGRHGFAVPRKDNPNICDLYSEGMTLCLGQYWLSTDGVFRRVTLPEHAQ